MPRSMPRRVTIVVVAVVGVALLAAAVVVAVRWWHGRDDTAFEQAAAYAPSDAERLSWTDWAGVRKQVGTDLDAAYDADLSSASALVESAPVLRSKFGFSPANAEWELFSQSAEGAVVIVKLPDGDAVDDVADHLDDVGFTRPDSDSGVWTGGDTLLPGIGDNLTPELQYVALVAGEGLVLTSDAAPYLQQVVAGLGDEQISEPMRSVVAASGEPLTAAVYDGDNVCSKLAMSQADADDQEAADYLIEKAGSVDPLTAYAMSVQPGGDVRAVMAFADHDQARANADSRATLATGPAPGQGGDFSERFSLTSATADGELVTLDLHPREGAYVFSDLSTGPVVFATC